MTKIYVHNPVALKAWAIRLYQSVDRISVFERGPILCALIGAMAGERNSMLDIDMRHAESLPFQRHSQL